MSYHIIKSTTLYVLIISIVILISGCIARFFAGEAMVMRSAVGRLALTETFVINAERMIIANDAMFAGALRRVFVRNRVLYIREAGGNSRAIGSVTGRKTVLIEGQQIQLPKDIYTVRGGKVNVRSSLGNDAHYKVYQHLENGQIVLKLYERQGYAYVQLGANEFGWILLSDLEMVNSAKDKESSVFEKCTICKQTGHAVQNIKCGLCKGSGHISCLYCKGSKELPCYTCARTGKLNCVYCLGKGTEQCGSCIGLGYHLDDFRNKSRCNECDSTGKLQCSTCKGSPQKDCYDCYGHGATPCNQCFGAGFDICFQCYKEGFFSADIQCRRCMGTLWVRSK